MEMTRLTGASACIILCVTLYKPGTIPTRAGKGPRHPESSHQSVGLSQAAQAQAGQSSPALQPTSDEAKFLSNITQLTTQKMGLLNAGEAYFSPAGDMIIFQATPIGASEYQIYTLDLETRKLRMVSTGKGACTCAYFHPDAKKILFSSTHLDPNLGKEEKKEDASDKYKWVFHKYMNVFESDLDGSNLRPLTNTPYYDAEASYSADGKRIVFTSNRDDDLEIYVMDADGGNPQRMTHAKGYDGGPFFSPDGKTILYRGDRRGGDKMNLQLRMVNADGSNDRALTDNPVFNWCPYWYPSGKCFIFTQTDHAAYTRGERPNYDLFMRTVDNERLTRITFDPAFDGLPVFSPGGKRLMWTSMRGGLEEAQIFIADFRLPPELN
jgi:Tol biopolymer transport system component